MPGVMPWSSRPMKKRVGEICNVLYGQGNVSCEPSNAEIAEAVRNEEFELRGFQHDLATLQTEWQQVAQNNFDEFCRLVKMYHARRIAFFVVNGWSQPIVLRSDGCTIEDGLHRFKAALYKGMPEVEITVLSSATMA
jgi:hypothetical protein